MVSRDDKRKQRAGAEAEKPDNLHNNIRYKHKALDNRRKARALLSKLMPEAERRAPEMNMVEASSSSLGANTFKHIHIDRVTGVHVYQGERGGWYFDLTFKDLPPGVPNVLGQPVAYPLETREEAINGAVSMLAMLISTRDKTLPGHEDAEAVFPFDDVVITLPSVLIRALESAPVPVPDFGYVCDRLDETRRQFAGDGTMTEDVMGRLTDDQRMQVFTVVAMAICRGIARWPQFEEGVPKSKQH